MKIFLGDAIDEQVSQQNGLLAGLVNQPARKKMETGPDQRSFIVVQSENR